MAQVTLEEFKKHAHIDYDDDDDVLTTYLAAAEEYVVRYTHRTLDDLVSLGGGTFPRQLKQAVLLIAGTYADRKENEGSQTSELKYGATALMRQFRKLGEDTE